jgi:hypothetical protein
MYEFPAGIIPSGVIVMWSGLVANIPAGWTLCDGTLGTPDLRDRFILSVGAAEDPGAIGGSLTLVHAGVTVSDHPVLAHLGADVANHAALSHAGTAVGTHSGYLTGAASAGAQWNGPSLNTLTLATHTHSIPALVHNVTQPNNHPIQTHTVTQPNDHPIQVHVVTQPNDHADIRPPFFKLAFIMKT